MRGTYESFATIDNGTAFDVAHFLEGAIKTMTLHPDDKAKWQEVADALFAIINDTDAILCREDHSIGKPPAVAPFNADTDALEKAWQFIAMHSPGNPYLTEPGKSVAAAIEAAGGSLDLHR